jgi:CBS-domain-containing membrane protein
MESEGLRILDEGFKRHRARYVLQCLLATLVVFVVLLLLDTMSNTTTIAALGASSFIVFTMPHSQISRPRFLIGGYLVGMTAGCLCRGLCLVSALTRPSNALFGAIAVGLAIFLMVVTDTEHPPAAGLALGFVLNEECGLRVLAVVLIGVISLSVMRAALRPVLRNLL